LAKQGGFPGVLAFVGADRHIERRAASQRQQHDKPRDREAYAWLLRCRLRIRGLVLRGIRHAHGGAINQFDRPSTQQIAIGDALVQLNADVASQSRTDPLRQPLPRFAIRPRMRRARRLSIVNQECLQPRDCITARMIRAEHLRKKRPQSN
jgi:hypothetical protein